MPGFREDVGFVYYLADPRSPRRPRYVGSTYDPAKREHQHRKTTAGNPALQDWKRELQAAGVAPRLVVLAALDTRSAATEAEWRLIGRWKRRGLCDLNSQWEGAGRRWELLCAGLNRRRSA